VPSGVVAGGRLKEWPGNRALTATAMADFKWSALFVSHSASATLAAARNRRCVARAPKRPAPLRQGRLRRITRTDEVPRAAPTCQRSRSSSRSRARAGSALATVRSISARQSYSTPHRDIRSPPWSASCSCPID
jgi:hypothetical protein